MLIVALVLAVIGLAALVTAVVTSNELVAWVCIAASVVGVILLIVDAIRERQQRRTGDDEPAPVTTSDESVESSATAETTAYSETDETVDTTYSTFDADYPEDEGPAAAEPETAEDVAEEPAETTDEAASDDADPVADEPEEQKSGESGSR
ncbi:phage holin family protein [Mycolicibacterium aichiense]|uniref:Transmembrane protein n=1 Tax=Mycolicibacterium aichiense TaxID=1799 RepID=A0AAD1HNT8_9MYCO|nr:phage holin family protein [Mycolicibacterium aichiense]MCV7018967.1 hypothetical protein [Mycolicibacterium aichiense]BBX08489.1 hypothetical protein MAIC_32920 [Mycolicibacterium aichiense]STZ82286.1 putative transmembrane protein [Mycolicibacterium aichiense]